VDRLGGGAVVTTGSAHSRERERETFRGQARVSQAGNRLSTEETSTRGELESCGYHIEEGWGCGRGGSVAGGAQPA